VKRVVKSRREGRKQADLEPIFEAVFGIGGGRE